MDKSPITVQMLKRPILQIPWLSDAGHAHILSGEMLFEVVIIDVHSGMYRAAVQSVTLEPPHQGRNCGYSSTRSTRLNICSARVPPTLFFRLTPLAIKAGNSKGWIDRIAEHTEKLT